MLPDPSCGTVADRIQVDELSREYARLAPLAHLQFPSAPPGAFNRIHDVLLNEILLDPHLCVYPPAPEYQLKFWKWAVRGLESLLGNEVNLRVFVRYCASGLKQRVGRRNRRKDLRSYSRVDSVHVRLATSNEGSGPPFAIVCDPLLAVVPRIPECDPPRNATGVSHNNRTRNDWAQNLADRARLSRVAWKAPRFSMTIRFPQQVA